MENIQLEELTESELRDTNGGVLLAAVAWGFILSYAWNEYVLEK